MNKRRVVVTGIGAISGNGLSAPQIWQNLQSGFVTRTPLKDFHFDPENFAGFGSLHNRIETVCGVPCTNDELATQIGLKEKIKHYDRHQLFALIAAREALLDSGALGSCSPKRFGSVLGTGDGGLHESFHASAKLLAQRKLDPYSIIRHLSYIGASNIARTFDLRGPHYVHTTGCTASAHVITHGYDLIQLGRADLVLVGGYEATITPLGVAGFYAQRAISNHSLPFQKNRQGFLMGEGAAMCVLEDYEHATARGAHIYAELCGYGVTHDGETDAGITAPGIQGACEASQDALRMAGIEPSQVEYVNLHGTGTPLGDVAELQSMQSWVNPSAEIAVSSTKSYSGHLFGAAGAFEAILTVLMLKHEVLLPTYGLTSENFDEACAIPGVRFLLENESRACTYALSHSFGFGGVNASLLFKKA